MLIQRFDRPWGLSIDISDKSEITKSRHSSYGYMRVPAQVVRNIFPKYLALRLQHLIREYVNVTSDHRVCSQF